MCASVHSHCVLPCALFKRSCVHVCAHLCLSLALCSPSQTRTAPSRSHTPKPKPRARPATTRARAQVKAVQQKVVPELDDDFAASIQPGLTLAGLDQKVREGVQAEVDKAVRELTLNSLEATLVSRLVPGLAVPDRLITEHARKRWAEALSDARSKQVRPNPSPTFP